MCAGRHSQNPRREGMDNGGGLPHLPHARSDPAPSVPPRLGLFLFISGSDAERALKSAREAGQATTLMYALFPASIKHIYCGNYAAVYAQLDELIALADERGTVLESTWNHNARLGLWTDRKSLGCSSGDHLGDHLTSVK